MMANKTFLAFFATTLLSSSVNAFVSTPTNTHSLSNTELSMSNDVTRNNNDAMMQRRAALGSVFGIVLGVSSISPSNALDMDAFINAELDADKKNCDPKRDPKCIPVLTADEALCKYGQSGSARGEACKRVKESGKALPTSKPQGKSLGGAYAM